MCRIAGLVSNRLQINDINNIVTTMCNAMQHGGPDDEGVFLDVKAGLAFGHRRLSIIDLSRNGHQPMADVQQRAWISFNGEIYNYLELKKQLLIAGARFSSDTDTEVIIQAYLYWGTDCFKKLRGMFAFALYDIAKQCVYLVRDTTGIKPLYYCAKDKQLIFSSEIRAIKAAGINIREDRRWPVWLLAFGHIPEPYTTLKDTLSIPKGHFLCWDKDGSYTISNYSAENSGNYITDIKIAQKGIHDHLQNAVTRQLIADAPVGVFLSGGTDSSIITLLADQIKKEQLKTISIYFDEKNYDERAFQDAVLKGFRGESFKHLVKQKDFETYLPDITASMDMPTTDGINSWFISKYAHEDGLKAVLSGIGADELFGGYPSFKRIKYIKLLKKLPRFFIHTASTLNKGIYKRLAYLKHDHHLAAYLFIRGLYAPADIALILNMNENEVNNILFDTHPAQKINFYDKMQAAWFETNLYMQNQLLRDTDVMSMRHGLEVRVPYLDEDLQYFVNRIDPAIRFNNSTPKKILTDSFRSLLPQEVWKRPKMGFSFPLDKWMLANARISDEGNYAGKAAKAQIKSFNKGQLHWSKAYALYQIQKHV